MHCRRLLLLSFLIVLTGCPTDTGGFGNGDDDDDSTQQVDGDFAITTLDLGWEQLGGAAGWTLAIGFDLYYPPAAVETGDIHLLLDGFSLDIPMASPDAAFRSDIAGSDEAWHQELRISYENPSAIEVEAWVSYGSNVSEHLTGTSPAG